MGTYGDTVTYILLRGKLDFTELTNFTEAVASVASYVSLHVATTLPVNSVSVTTPAKKTPIGKSIIIFFDQKDVFLTMVSISIDKCDRHLD